MPQISLKEIVGGGYNEFWRSKHRYRIVKGSRGSKKSTTAALWYVVNMMKYPESNLLVVRRIFKDHEKSTYSQLQWAMNKLGVTHLWKCTKNPVQMTYIPTGQRILFVGMDDPLSITSVTVPVGALSFVWIEEASQLSSYEAFNKLDESIRADVKPPLFLQVTITFNPWTKNHWLHDVFWKRYLEGDPDVFFITTTYKCNEFLHETFHRNMEWMKENNPRRYQVAGLGDWGITDGQVFENWKEEEFNISEIINKKVGNSDKSYYELMYGLDFGFAQDPTAFVALAVSRKDRIIYLYDEIYEYEFDNTSLANELKARGYEKNVIMADNDPSRIHELKLKGIRRLRKAKKGPGSLKSGITRLQDFTIVIHPSCQNAIAEFSNYVYEKRDDMLTSKPIDEWNHTIDAMRYATEDLDKAKFEFM